MKLATLSIFFAMSLAHPTFAQVSYKGGELQETFNSMHVNSDEGPSPLPDGWFVKSGNAVFSRMTTFTSPGGINSTGIYDFGAQNSEERALGAMTSTAPTSEQTIEWRIQNDSGKTYPGFTLAYTGIQWRADIDPKSLEFSYSLDGGKYVVVKELAFASPSTGEKKFIKQSSGEHRLPVGPAKVVFEQGKTWENNQTLFLRWSMPPSLVDSGNGVALGIDDLTFHAIEK